MQIAPALRVQCPRCKTIKELSNLYSGNTCGGTIWSDTRAEYPMLPMNSPVQKCPVCRKYFFLDDAKILPSEKDTRLERIRINITQRLREAYERKGKENV